MVGLLCVQTLYQKQGRSSQFKSRQDRDEWIKKEVEQLEKTETLKITTRKELEKQIQQLSEELMNLSQVTSLRAVCSFFLNVFWRSRMQ